MGGRAYLSYHRDPGDVPHALRLTGSADITTAKLAGVSNLRAGARLLVGPALIGVVVLLAVGRTDVVVMTLGGLPTSPAIDRGIRLLCVFSLTPAHPGPFRQTSHRIGAIELKGSYSSCPTAPAAGSSGILAATLVGCCMQLCCRRVLPRVLFVQSERSISVP